MVTTSRILPAIVAIIGSGCGARSGLTTPSDAHRASVDAAIAFPTGRYTNCASGVFDPMHGSAILNGSGSHSGAALTVMQDGTTLTATFVDENHVTTTLDFALTGAASAILAPDGQVAPNFATLCVTGPRIESFVPANLHAMVGALAYDSNTVFVSATGTIVDTDAGPCGVQSAPGDFWIACQAADAGAPAPPPVDAGAPAIPLGEYACTSQVDSYELVGGINQYVADGAEGTLTLTQSGADVTAGYVDDRTINGSLHFVATSATTARAATGQSMDAVCDVPLSPGTSTVRGAMSVTAGTMMLDGATLVVSLFGSMTSGCTGAEKVLTLFCAQR